jgi:SAM-dependent methyltransferase
MQPKTYDNLSAAEQTHWWFRHRRAVTLECLRRARIPADGGVALDIGCGTGGNLPLLAAFSSKVVGLDLSERALSLCAAKQDDAVLVRANANGIGRTLAAGSIDLASLFNVLYHSWVQDDAKVLSGTHRVLKPGGTLLVCEAAFTSLRRQRDRLDQGARRYRMAGLAKKIERAGFEIECATYFNAIGFAPAWLLARFDHWSGAYRRPLDEDRKDRDLDVSNTWTQRFAYAVTGIERAWLRLGGRLPFGINFLIVARKKEKGTDLFLEK